MSKVDTNLSYISSLHKFLFVNKFCFFIPPFLKGLYDFNVLVRLKSRIDVIDDYFY